MVHFLNPEKPWGVIASLDSNDSQVVRIRSIERSLIKSARIINCKECNQSGRSEHRSLRRNRIADGVHSGMIKKSI